jgi:hypothetical protein
MYNSDELPDYFDADLMSIAKRLDERWELRRAADQLLCIAPSVGTNGCHANSLFATNQS